jgi:hypothetical protein
MSCLLGWHPNNFLAITSGMRRGAANADDEARALLRAA